MTGISKNLSHMPYTRKVGHIQDPICSRIDPLLLGRGLALRAVPVPAGVVDRMLSPAARTDLQMAAEGSRATPANGRQDALLAS